MARQQSKLTGRLEDYLEAVLVLVRESGSARVRDIAARTDVSMSSVSTALKQLAAAGLVNYDPYELTTLTAKGEALAGAIRQRHTALSDFLTGVLDVDEAVAEANACRMEHVVDDEVLDRLGLLAAFLSERAAHGSDRAKAFSKYCRRRESRPARPTKVRR